jgi:2,4-dienoyl-CoA reductase-like NADH-dependent reductase (Old Yellow Enzyme family)
MSVLFEPLEIGALTLRNRVVMPPMVRGRQWMAEDVVETKGAITEAVLEHYRARARGGAGLVIVEATAVDRRGRAWVNGLNLFDDDHVDGMRRLASAIREAGAAAAVQLVHAGPKGTAHFTGELPAGPSERAASGDVEGVRRLAVDEIEAIEGRFADAAERATDAGFDAVEVHGAHGFLLDSFLSETQNRRQDAYGGGLGGRLRFLRETCQKVRNRVGSRGLVTCRISLFNKRSEGWERSDLAELIGGLAGTGLDAVHVSTDGAFRPFADSERSIGQCVRAICDLPVIVAGGLTDPLEAERLIAEGHADLAAVGRAMLKDADWARHAREALEG